MEEFIEIFVYSLLVFCGSLFGGLLPLLLDINDHVLNNLSIFPDHRFLLKTIEISKFVEIGPNQN